jgi:hypothetical protein
MVAQTKADVLKNVENPARLSDNIKATSIKSSSDKILGKIPVDMIFVLIVVFDPRFHGVVASSWVDERSIKQCVDCYMHISTGVNENRSPA